MTALYPHIVYGPVRSRRLGLSLGVNLLPLEAKLCTFDCIYCECGWNGDNSGSRKFNTKEEVAAALEGALAAMVADNELPDNNYKYICTQHGSTAVCKSNANKYERRN